MDYVEGLPVPDDELLRTVVESFRSALSIYEPFYRIMHQNPEMSSMKLQTASLVAGHLNSFGFEIYGGLGATAL